MEQGRVGVVGNQTPMYQLLIKLTTMNLKRLSVKGVENGGFPSMEIEIVLILSVGTPREWNSTCS